ncbi:FeoA family protein [Clostridium isatidis]|uniref:Iron transporter FeoA n=1 Tax=Clostridium isatidis TaxID=182773 RepID=A0A343JDB6_9CLOT|nr:ferrous iron transport protein A [Clostridium isatidis]ASW43524.1 iron transporter FeoA [Clostridium isatidis]NLZ35503.1 ferrous iron transport protein A [Clostridiales bacterium]
MTVYNLKVGEKGTVKEVLGDKKLAKRLLALGCVKGTELEVKMVAPLGDPILVSFRGFDLAIRKKDAKNIHLSK